MFSTVSLLLSYCIFNLMPFNEINLLQQAPSHGAVGNVGFCLLSTQEGAQVTFLHPEQQLNGENPLGGTQQPELAGASGGQYSQLACGQQRHGLQLQSPLSGTRGWMGFATSSSPRDPMLYCACTRPLKMIICAMMCSFHWHKS